MAQVLVPVRYEHKKSFVGSAVHCFQQLLQLLRSIARRQTQAIASAQPNKTFPSEGLKPTLRVLATSFIDDMLRLSTRPSSKTSRLSSDMASKFLPRHAWGRGRNSMDRELRGSFSACRVRGESGFPVWRQKASEIISETLAEAKIRPGQQCYPLYFLPHFFVHGQFPRCFSTIKRFSNHFGVQIEKGKAVFFCLNQLDFQAAAKAKEAGSNSSEMVPTTSPNICRVMAREAAILLNLSLSSAKRCHPDCHMPEVRLSNPRKRQRTEHGPHQLNSVIAASVQKDRRLTIIPPKSQSPAAFWDNLSKIWLTKQALRELDRRNSQPNSNPALFTVSIEPVDLLLDAPQLRKRSRQTSQSATDFLRYCAPKVSEGHKRISAKHGGPDLSDLQGVCITRQLFAIWPKLIDVPNISTRNLSIFLITHDEFEPVSVLAVENGVQHLL